MTLDTLPPFVTFLLPTPRMQYRKNQPLPTNSSTTSLSSCSTSFALSANTTPTSSPTSSSLTVSSCNSPSSYSTSESPLEIKKSLLSPSSARTYLKNGPSSTLRCIKCSTDLAYTTQVLSKGFTGRLGRAYLVAPPPQPPFIPSFPPKPRPKADLVNTRTEKPTNRELMTGWHIVADVTCVVCTTVVGWKYIDTCEESQRYKIGKYILERERVCTGEIWEEENIFKNQQEKNIADMKVEWEEGGSESTIQFDSGDEEECDSLFTGTWDKDVVAKRRKIKMTSNREGDVKPAKNAP